LLPHRPLAVGQLVRQGRVEGGEEPVVAPWPGGGWPGGGAQLPLHQGELDSERLVPLETFPGWAERVPRGRPVDVTQRGGQVDQPTGGAQVRRQWVDD